MYGLKIMSTASLHSMQSRPLQMQLFTKSAQVAEEMKTKALQKVLNNSTPDWKRLGMEAIRRLSKEQRWFTSDDLPQEVRDLAHHQNAIGALFNAARRAGLIVFGGYVKSRRPSSKRRVIAVYRGGVYGTEDVVS